MTRPKVPLEQRQRTAQACESCKRRKQKCNGQCPCNTCEKRKFDCIYTDRDADSPSDGRPTKKRILENGQVEQSRHNSDGLGHTFTGNYSNAQQNPTPQGSSNHHQSSFPPLEADHSARHDESFKVTDEQPSMEAAARSLQQFAAGPPAAEPATYMSRGTTQSGQDEEAVVFTQTRMLQDPTGRLLYVGDSATLSFLQLLRMMVENVAGPSPFINDPRRHKITEGQFSLPPSTRHTHLLPDKATAQVLVDSFFVNTHGFLQVFERQKFVSEVDRCYNDPLSTDPSWLCLLNLVFSIGLTMAHPLSGSNEAAVIDKLRTEHLDRAEVFYSNARGLHPLTGLEDADFWSVQALLLQATYMLAKSKRNTAFALLGMAVRSAYALGLHREETMIIFTPEEQASRRNLWRSLFVMDRFLSCSLGRPVAIAEEDCSGDALRPGDSNNVNLSSTGQTSFGQTSALSLEAAVRSCSVIGLILKRVYQQRKISTRLAQEIADICKSWPRALAPSLHWRQAATASPSQGVAILHVNLFYCHSIILLTRPFFLYILNAETQKDVTQAGTRPPRPPSRMEKFSEACVIASTHTILLVQNAFEAGYLPRRNAVVIYFLFAAALVILANEFAGLHNSPAADTCITNAVNVMAYCAESDQQASRLLYILSSFREVAKTQRSRRRQAQTGHINLPSISSQLYGIQRPTSESLQPTPPGIHNVPVHVYPGMQQSAPPPSDPTAAYTPHINLQPTMQTPTMVNANSPPISNIPTSNDLPPLQPTPSQTSSPLDGRPLSLSNVLDLSALDAARAPSLHSEESYPDEHIDFDALWAWPSNTPAIGSPMVGGEGLQVQGGGDFIVPLFGVVEMGDGTGGGG